MKHLRKKIPGAILSAISSTGSKTVPPSTIFFLLSELINQHKQYEF